MRKILLITLLFAAMACSKGISEKDVIGKYKVTFVMNSNEPTDEASGFALAMFASADIQYELKKGGILSGVVTMGSMSENNETKWKLSGDSIFLDIENKPDEFYTISKADKGFLLAGGSVNLKLTEID